MLSSTAELARMTGMDTATTATANPSRKASEARLRVVPPPRGPSTIARSRCAARGPVLGARRPAGLFALAGGDELAVDMPCTLPTLALLGADIGRRHSGPYHPAEVRSSGPRAPIIDAPGRGRAPLAGGAHVTERG